MATFDDIVSTTKELVTKAGQKANDFIDVTKLKLDVKSIEQEISSIYKSIGQLVYDAYKNEEEMPELIDECVEKLDAKFKELKAVRDEIDEYNELLRCKNCETANTPDAVFCKRCGTKTRQ